MAAAAAPGILCCLRDLAIVSKRLGRVLEDGRGNPCLETAEDCCCLVAKLNTYPILAAKRRGILSSLLGEYGRMMMA